MNDIHHFIVGIVGSLNLSSFLEVILIGFFDLIILTSLALLLDVALKKVLLLLAKRIVLKTKFSWDNILFENRVFNSVSHFISISIIILLTASLVPKKYGYLLDFINNMLYSVFIIIFIQFITRIINAIVAISTSENNHRTVAVRSFAQLSKIITYIIGAIMLVSILLKQDITVIIGSLSALTAVIILVFKDTILGFVSGVQIASTRMIKVGDWIEVSKHNVNGVVLEINLVSAKIRNWDKTISSVPSYDLISTTVKSYEPMKEANVRRIKRSLIFNIKSFSFLDSESLEKFKKFELLQTYLEEMEKEMAKENTYHNTTSPSSINGRQLTNIGLFRIYAENYLKQNKNIASDQTLMVRQLDPTPHGLPLEIYCFTANSEWLVYEKIQSDIFDHLLTSASQFDLEIVQILTR